MKTFNRVLILTSLLLLGSPVAQADNHRIPIPGIPNIPIPGLHPTIPTPDLVVQRLVKNGSAVIRSGKIQVPIRVTVKNQGRYKAAPFKVSAHDATAGRDYVIHFNAGDNRWYPRYLNQLAPGRSVTLVGKLTFGSEKRGQTVTVKVKADSCAGEEFMPGYCRVNELNEHNNWSGLLNIALP